MKFLFMPHSSKCLLCYRKSHIPLLFQQNHIKANVTEKSDYRDIKTSCVEHYLVQGSR